MMNVTIFKHALQPYCQQCACTASNAIEYLNISGLVTDFATSPVRARMVFRPLDRAGPCRILGWTDKRNIA